MREEHKKVMQTEDKTNEPKGINVAVHGTLEFFGWPEVRRALASPGTPRNGAVGTHVYWVRSAEIRDLGRRTPVGFLVNHDVDWLQVAMAEAVTVQLRQPRRDVPHQINLLPIRLKAAVVQMLMIAIILVEVAMAT